MKRSDMSVGWKAVGRAIPGISTGGFMRRVIVVEEYDLWGLRKLFMFISTYSFCFGLEDGIGLGILLGPFEVQAIGGLQLNGL
jgi:hypothetical protein